MVIVWLAELNHREGVQVPVINSPLKLLLIGVFEENRAILALCDDLYARKQGQKWCLSCINPTSFLIGWMNFFWQDAERYHYNAVESQAQEAIQIVGSASQHKGGQKDRGTEDSHSFPPAEIQGQRVISNSTNDKQHRRHEENNLRDSTNADT